MNLRDLSFSVKLRTDDFNKNAEKSRKLLQDLAKQKMDKLNKEIVELTKKGEMSGKEVARLTKEWDKYNKMLDKTAGHARTAAKEMRVLGSVMTGIWQGVGQKLFSAVAGMPGRLAGAGRQFLSGSLNEAIGERKANEQLRATLRGTGNMGWEKAMQSTADKAKRAYRMDDDKFKLGYQQLLLGGMNPQQAMGQTSLMADISKGMGSSPDQAADLINKAWNGQSKALKGAGIFDPRLVETGDPRKDSMVAMQVLKEKFGGAAAAGAGAGAQSDPFAWLAQQMADIKQKIGEGVLTAIAGGLERMSAMLDRFTASGGFEKLVADLSSVAMKMVDWGSKLVAMLATGDLWKMLNELLGEFLRTLGDVLATGGIYMAKVLANAIAPDSVKSAEQLSLDEMKGKTKGMTKGQLSGMKSTVEQELAAAKESGNPGLTNKKGWEVWALNELAAGRDVFMGKDQRTMGDVFGDANARMDAKMQKFFPGGSPVEGAVADSAAAQAQAQGELAGIGSAPIGASPVAMAKWQAEQADKAAAARKKLNAAAGSANQKAGMRVVFQNVPSGARPIMVGQP